MGPRLWLGIGCIIMAVLVLLICAPDWLVALMISLLLFCLGLWLLGFGHIR